MKVALALHGQPRFYRKTYEHFFSNIIEMFDADVFFHTFWSKNMVGSIYPCADHAKASLSDEDMTVQDDTIDWLKFYYNPKEYTFDDYDWFKPDTNYQYASQYEVKEILVEYVERTGIQYDLVIRSRFDLMCTQDIDFIYDDSLWVPSTTPYPDRENDMFSISNYDTFCKISDAFLNIEEFKAQGKGEMEWVLQCQIEKEKIKVKRFEASWDSFDVLRSDTQKKFK